MKYIEARQCADCKKVYKKSPYICKKCGARLLNDLSCGTYRTNKCNVVIAKKTLFGWKVKEVEE